MRDFGITIGKTIIEFMYEKKTFVLLKSKGLKQIIDLMMYPDKEVHCTTLYAEDMAKVWEAQKRYGASEALVTDGSISATCPGLGGDPIMDSRYVTEIKEELRWLKQQLAEAQENRDIGMTDMIQGKIEYLQKYLLEHTDISGKSKSMPREYTKAKDAVRKSINGAIDDIKEKDRTLAKLILDNIRIGEYCCYHRLPSLDISVKKDKELDKQYPEIRRTRKPKKKMKAKVTDLTTLCCRPRFGVRTVRVAPFNRQII